MFEPICCTGVMAAACTQGKRTHHGKPYHVLRDEQPDARGMERARWGGVEASGTGETG
jgi:hypothetical protein